MKKFSEAMNEIDSKYINEAIQYKRKKQRKVINNSWKKWGMIAACLCLIFVGGFSLSNIFQNPVQSPENVPPIKEDIVLTQPEEFITISTLLGINNGNDKELAEVNSTIPIGKYTGIYSKVDSSDNDLLSRSTGKLVEDTENWYYVSGHTDMQYLIQNENEIYSLWKFKCFDAEEYPYSDVLTLVYQIDSATQISEIVINPATMDNTDYGKELQEQIGIHSVTDVSEIETVYQILSTLTCYGENHWDMIDYGSVEVSVDEPTPSNNAVLLGRYLTLITSYGNEIDGLKYTAVSNMFYEYSGIAYNQLTENQSESMSEILHIKKELIPESENNSQPMQTEAPSTSTTVETTNTDITLEYITELQEKVSTAMINGELPFVISSAVYENPYRLYVTVSSNAETDLAKLEALDTIGGALEIEYTSDFAVKE